MKCSPISSFNMNMMCKCEGRTKSTGRCTRSAHTCSSSKKSKYEKKSVISESLIADEPHNCNIRALCKADFTICAAYEVSSLSFCL